MCGPLNSEKKDESLLDKFKHGVEDIYESASDFIQGAGSAVAEDYIGLTPPDNDKLESNATYQAGRFTGHVLSTVGSIVEIFEGISVIGGANFLTFVAEVGSGGLASPIVLPLDAVAIAAGLGAVGHGGFVLNKSIQNAQDTLQKFESSGGRVSETNKVKSFQNRIDNIRNSMPNNTLKKRGNMATADVKIPGLKDKFNAHSKINSKFDKGADVEEFSMLKPESERIFKSYEPSASKPDATKFDKFHDTEAKILEDIASQIKNPNISGKIDLYTELPACQSCSNIILEFRKRYPNIHLNIHTKN